MLKFIESNYICIHLNSIIVLKNNLNMTAPIAKSINYSEFVLQFGLKFSFKLTEYEYFGWQSEI